jgi:ABC-type polysaccharide/polyol phosphate export permease
MEINKTYDPGQIEKRWYKHWNDKGYFSATIDKDKYVDVVFEDLANERIIAEELINTNLLYKQMVLGVILAFLGIYILFCATSINRDYEVKMISKINITKTSHLTLVVGQYLSIFVGVLPIVIIFSVINSIFDQGIISFFQYLLVYLLYAMVASALTLVLAMMLPTVSSYIVIGSAIVLIIGIISGSFFNIDLTVDSIKQMASITYSYHALNQLMDIITLKALPNLMSYVRFMAISLLVLLGLSMIIHRLKVREIN